MSVLTPSTFLRRKRGSVDVGQYPSGLLGRFRKTERRDPVGPQVSSTLESRRIKGTNNYSPSHKFSFQCKGPSVPVTHRLYPRGVGGRGPDRDGVVGPGVSQNHRRNFSVRGRPALTQRQGDTKPNPRASSSWTLLLNVCLWHKSCTVRDGPVPWFFSSSGGVTGYQS